MSGYTTAKVTVAHGLICDHVRCRFGDEGRATTPRSAPARHRPAFTYAEPGSDTGPLATDGTVIQGPAVRPLEGKEL